jgi:hypothetical protein
MVYQDVQSPLADADDMRLDAVLTRGAATIKCISAD